MSYLFYLDADHPHAKGFYGYRWVEFRTENPEATAAKLLEDNPEFDCVHVVAVENKKTYVRGVKEK